MSAHREAVNNLYVASSCHTKFLLKCYGIKRFAETRNIGL